MIQLVVFCLAWLAVGANVPKVCTGGTVKRLKLAETPKMPEIFKESPMYPATFDFYIMGTEPISVQANFCFLIKRTHWFSLGFVGTKTTGEYVSRIGITAETCQKWVNEGKCEYGTLQPNSLINGSSETRNVATAKYIWLSTMYDDVHNCHVESGMVKKRPLASSVSSTFGDISHCRTYESGFCSLGKEGMVIFQPAKQWFCDFMYTRTEHGTFSAFDKVWLSEKRNRAISFQSDEVKQAGFACNDNTSSSPIVMSDQGIGVISKDVDVIRGEIISHYRSKRGLLKHLWSRDSPNRQVIQAEQAMGFQATSMMTRSVFLSTARYIFQFRAEEIKYLNNQVRSNPTAAAQHILNSTLVRATYSGGLLIWAFCTAALNLTTLPMEKNQCLQEVPVNYLTNGDTQIKFGFLRTSDNEIIDYATPASCEAVAVSTYIQFGPDSHGKYDPYTGTTSPVTPDLILPLFSHSDPTTAFNSTLLKQTIFQPNALTTNHSEPLPEQEMNARWRFIWKQSSLHETYKRRMMTESEAKTKFALTGLFEAVLNALRIWFTSLVGLLILVVAVFLSYLQGIVFLIRALFANRH